MAEFNEEIEVVTLYDEDGNSQDYEVVDIFEFNDSIYAAVTPYQDEYDEAIPLEVTMLKVIEENEEEIFVPIETEEEELEAYNELLRRDEEYNG